MFNFIKNILGITDQSENKEPVNYAPTLYKDGIRRVCSSLDILFTEFERTGIVCPWHVSDACKGKHEDANSSSSGCYHVIGALSGIVYEYTRRILKKQLLDPLLNTKTGECLRDEQYTQEFAELEQNCLRDALVQWFKKTDLDWCRAEMKTRQFVNAFEKSNCDKFFQTDLRSNDSLFLSEDNLKDFCGNQQCAISYTSGVHFLTVDGLIAGFIEEILSRYRAEINSSGLLTEPLNI